MSFRRRVKRIFFQQFLDAVSKLTNLQETKIKAQKENDSILEQAAMQEQKLLLSSVSSNPIAALYSKLPADNFGRSYLDALIFDGSGSPGANASQTQILARKLSGLISKSIERRKKILSDGGPRFVGLRNYFELLGKTDSDFWKVLWQTIFWTATNVFFHFLIGLCLALMLNKRFRGNTVYRLLIMVPWAVPSFVAAFSWRFMFNYPDGLINGILRVAGFNAINFLGNPGLMLPTCILINVWAGVPFMMITLLGGLQNISEDMYEAAKIDGANTWQKFLNITLPCLKPVASIAVLLGVIWTFNMFNIIYLVTLGNEAIEKDIFVTFAYKSFRTHGDYGGAAAYAVIILSILLSFASRYSSLLEREERKGRT
ncbi:sugar ABC transporter permease [bacterium]|nr:sugar ABC transporter permease [bacterium]